MKLGRCPAVAFWTMASNEEADRRTAFQHRLTKWAAAGMASALGLMFDVDMHRMHVWPMEVCLQHEAVCC